MQDRIEKLIELKAPIAKVWKALTDYQEFGQWFRVDLEGPFVVGEVSRGQITYPGYEHMKWEVMVKAMDTEALFSFTWHPYPDDAEKVDEELEILVEFRLSAIPGGTRLDISESGFAALPDEPRRHDMFRSNTEGWEIQARNIAAHVES